MGEQEKQGRHISRHSRPSVQSTPRGNGLWTFVQLCGPGEALTQPGLAGLWRQMEATSVFLPFGLSTALCNYWTRPERNAKEVLDYVIQSLELSYLIKTILFPGKGNIDLEK